MEMANNDVADMVTLTNLTTTISIVLSTATTATLTPSHEFFSSSNTLRSSIKLFLTVFEPFYIFPLITLGLFGNITSIILFSMKKLR